MHVDLNEREVGHKAPRGSTMPVILARLADDSIARANHLDRTAVGSVDDVAAVVFAVTQPIEVNVCEIVVRPPKMLGL
jgi:hypothetical protein